jgi:hypothetical protein
MASVRTVAWKDPPDRWPQQYSAPPEFDRAQYQQQLDSITGLSRERSILRLEWGGEERIMRYGAMDPGSPDPTGVVYEPKFKLRKTIHGIQILVPFKRWVITQLAEWEEYGYGDDSQTTFYDETGALRRAAEKPRDLYTPLIYVGDHRFCLKDCCEKRICPGDYKAPDTAELFLIMDKTYRLKTERIKDPRAKDYTPEQKQKIATEWADMKAIKYKEFNEQLKEI